MKLKTILAAGLLLILVGCQPILVKPTKPILKIEQRADGGFCVDRENASKLGDYILELERSK
ncbi:hypothetical protein UFOVP194_33 [uncultured Caudovirales phage]|uniref:Lipoprotein n=1 Tax=uncultured Caudovirales phage TaxID=2100421 RepID=A0A6J7WFK9_9CAUD|nr:hypothetical protein UFOVP194_33 [uncultured Caudovirales phage]